MEHHFQYPENGNYIDHNLNPPPPLAPVVQPENPLEMQENPQEGDAMMVADEPVQLGDEHVQVPLAVMNPFALGPMQIPAPLPPQNPMANPPNPMESRNGDHHESFRGHKQIPIYIVEDHNQVIPFVHENIRKKFLPIEGNTLIHFDSHPDMLIPRDMPADDAYEASKLYMWHTIENWVMPNCYNGIFQNLVWVKPPWSNQIRNESQKIYVGKCKQTGKMRLECRENYFISEGLFKLRNELDDVREITLDTLTLGKRLIESGDDIGRMMYISENNDKTPTVLDIDLDFFSTKNPFLTLYDSADIYLRLKNLFKFTPPQSIDDADIIAAQAIRNEQLDELQELFYYLKDNKAMPDFEGPQPSPRYVEVGSIVDAAAEYYNVAEVDWDAVYNAGCTIDDHELPDHVSTPEELEIMFQSFKNFLDTFLDSPRIITISRSAGDEYTPHEQVNEIQAKVLEILNEKFMCAPPVLQYLEQAQAAQPQPQQPSPEVVDDDSMDPDPDSVSTLSSDTSRSSMSQMSSSESSSSKSPAAPCEPSDEAGPSN